MVCRPIVFVLIVPRCCVLMVDSHRIRVSCRAARRSQGCHVCRPSRSIPAPGLLRLLRRRTLLRSARPSSRLERLLRRAALSATRIFRARASQSRAALSSPPILLILVVADLLQPLDDLTVELFLNGDMRHARDCCGSMPVLLTRRDPDDITWPDCFGLTTPLLHPSGAGCDDQGLAQWVGVPCRSSAGLERHAGARRARWVLRLEQGVDAYRAGAVLGGSTSEEDRPD